MADKHRITEMMEATLARARELGNAETIIGKPITTPDGVTVIPVSKLTCGFGAGGSDYNSRNNGNKVLFGGGGGLGVDLTPISFIVIRGDKVDVLPASGTVAPAAGASGVVATVEKAVDALPGVWEKVETFLADRKAKKADKEAADQAQEVDVNREQA